MLLSLTMILTSFLYLLVYSRGAVGSDGFAITVPSVQIEK